MRRTPLLAGLVLAVAAAAGAFLGRDWLADDRPIPVPKRVFLVTIDTLRADHLGFMGYPRPVSPFLDRLAEEGLVFERTIAASSTTTACHASLFTALEPAQHGLVKNGIDMSPALLTMAEVFARRGYDTAAFSTARFLKGVGEGFQHFEPEKRYFPSSRFVDQAIAWIDGRPRRSRPFFLWLHLFDVHEWVKPEHVDAEMLARVRGLEPNGEELLAYLRRAHGIPGDAWRSDAELLAAVDRYDAQILRVDAELERFWHWVAAEGLDRDALWIVTSDHGEGLGNHYEKGHGSLIYNEQTHVPLVLAGDVVPRAGRVGLLSRHVDLLPTLADVLGEPLDDQPLPIAGRSLVPVIAGVDRGRAAPYAYSQRRDADERRLRMGWEAGTMIAIQTERYKYIHKSAGGDELYDLASDPYELRDLSDGPHPMKERMRAYLVERHRAMVDQGRHLSGGGINAEYVEQLEALGYL